MKAIARTALLTVIVVAVVVFCAAGVVALGCINVAAWGFISFDRMSQ